MSRGKPDEGERRTLEFPCFYCGVAAGTWCVVCRSRLFWEPTSRPASLLHADRFYAATNAGRLPIGGQA